MTLRTIIMFFLISFNSLSAQVTEEWIATFTGIGSGGNVPYRSATDKYGNIIIAGNSDSTSTDYIVLKYNQSGNLLWSRRYDGLGHSTDFVHDMVLDDSANIYVTGQSNEGASLGYTNWLTIKYGANGDFRWKQSLDWIGHGFDQAFSIALYKMECVYVTGLGDIGEQGRDAIVLAKYSLDGKLLWIRSYSSPGVSDDWGYSVVTDDSGFVYASGYSNPSKMITLKYDSEGNQIWIREFPRNSSEYANPLYSKIDKENNIIVNGFYEVSGQANFVTVKYDRNGNLLWSRIFDNPFGALDFTSALYIDGKSNVYVAGTSNGMATSADFLIIKYSPSGDTLWTRTYDNRHGEIDHGQAVTGDSTGNVYITGTTYSTVTSFDYLTLKYDIVGNLIWAKTYTNPLALGEDNGYTITLADNENVVVSGSSFLSNSRYGIVSIKYSQLTGLEIEPTSLPQYNNLNNYPNPFNPSTIINYDLNIAAKVNLKVYNILGLEIRILANEKQNEGHHSILFDGGNLPNSIYYYALYINGNLIETKKMVLIK